MTHLVCGIDEAGLGPLLGPLVLGWSSLELPRRDTCPWSLCRDVLSTAPTRDRTHLIVADSKRVFARNERGRRRLELAALALDGRRGEHASAADWLFRGPLAPSATTVARHPWYSELAPALPRWTDGGALELAGHRAARAFEREGVVGLEAGLRAVPAGELNDAIRTHGNKGRASWALLTPLLSRLLARARGREATVVVDRQGGRARYGALLAQSHPEWKVTRVSETEGRSAYRLDGPGRVELEFTERAEEHWFAVALASCVAKYGRELAMEAFNAWFARRAAGLLPTAGYTQDGWRWLSEAERARALTGLDRAHLVRDR